MCEAQHCRICTLFDFQVAGQPKVIGVDSDEVTPVPIPNTEVKLISVENTWLATAWEDRAVPVRMKPCREYSAGFLLSVFDLLIRSQTR